MSDNDRISGENTDPTESISTAELNSSAVKPVSPPQRPTEAGPTRPNWPLHILLFAATLVSTTWVGLLMSETYAAQQTIRAIRAFSAVSWPVAELTDMGTATLAPWYRSAAIWFESLSYSISLVGILFFHEMGHYLTAKKFGVDASPPYFIPFPGAFGTMGAFIKMRMTEKVPGDQLMRIGAFGPIWGFVVAVPILFVGMALSDVRPAPEDLDSAIQLGDSLILWLSQIIVVGGIPDGHDVWLHPMAYAGWAGMFVTALNLLPVSQLDGGHVFYCLLGERFNRLAPLVFAVMLGMVLFVFTGWFALCILIALIGVRHPPMSDDLPVRGRARTIGLVTVGIGVLTFIPVPFIGIAPGLIELLFG